MRTRRASASRRTSTGYGGRDIGGVSRLAGSVVLRVGAVRPGQHVEVRAEMARPPLEHDAPFVDREDQLVALLQVEALAQSARQHDLAPFADFDDVDQRFAVHGQQSADDVRKCNMINSLVSRTLLRVRWLRLGPSLWNLSGWGWGSVGG